MATRTTAEEVDKLVRLVKLLGIGFVALFLALVVHTMYVTVRLEEALRHSSPAELEAEDSARNDLYHLAEKPVEGQVVYVPAYSHIYHGDGDPYQLAITLSVRNTSQDNEIVVKSIRYFDTKGAQVKAYLDKPVRLPALGTTEIVVERDDTSGGSGANFLVEWHAKTPVTEPIIEAVMIATSSHQGISFARRGSVISVATPNNGANPGPPASGEAPK